MEENDNLEKLKQIGIRQISKETLISTSRIKNILDKEFGSIQRVHLVGFIQILERQYKVDLQYILAEYDAYCQQSKAEQTSKDKVQIKSINLDTNKSKYDAIDEQKKQVCSKQRFYITVVVVVIVVLIYLIYQNLTGKRSRNIAERHLQSTLTKQPKPPASEEVEIISVETAPLNDGVQTDEETPQEEQAQDKTSNDVLDTTTTATPEKTTDSMVVTAKEGAMIWLEIIDLDTKKRQYQGVTSSSYTTKIPEAHRLLLAFGHSHFVLDLNGQTYEFEKTNFPLYFIYEPENGLKKIDNSAYKRLVEQVQ